ncbi:nickel-dependent hydrogenase large subunit, partial [Desulforudis sp. 1190]
FVKLLDELIAFVDNVYIPDVLAVAGIYDDWFGIGAGCKNLLVWGVFPLTDEKDLDGQQQFIKRGRYTNGEWAPVDPQEVTEHVM